MGKIKRRISRKISTIWFCENCGEQYEVFEVKSYIHICKEPKEAKKK